MAKTQTGGIPRHARKKPTPLQMKASGITHEKTHTGAVLIYLGKRMVVCEQHGCANINALRVMTNRQFWYAVAIGMDLAQPFWKPLNRRSFIPGQTDLWQSLAIAGETEILKRLLKFVNRKTVPLKRRAELLALCSVNTIDEPIAQPDEPVAGDSGELAPWMPDKPVEKTPSAFPDPKWETPKPATSSSTEPPTPKWWGNKNVIWSVVAVVVAIFLLIVL